MITYIWHFTILAFKKSQCLSQCEQRHHGVWREQQSYSNLISNRHRPQNQENEEKQKCFRESHVTSSISPSPPSLITEWAALYLPVSCACIPSIPSKCTPGLITSPMNATLPRSRNVFVSAWTYIYKPIVLNFNFSVQVWTQLGESCWISDWGTARSVTG